MLLKRLIDRHESGSYKMDTLPKDFVDKEIKGVMAFQIAVTSIEATPRRVE